MQSSSIIFMPAPLRGQSTTEYLVALAVVAAVLLTTMPGGSMLAFFLDAVRTGWARLLTSIALPV